MINKYFQLQEKQTTVKVEFVAGLTTFLTMAYIIFVNPAILSSTGMNKEALIAVTCIVSAIATIITGVFAKAPIAMAPGMGLNAFFVYLVGSGKMDWQTALGVVFLSGLFFLILTFIGVEKKNCRGHTGIAYFRYCGRYRAVYYIYRPEKSWHHCQR